MNLTHLISSTNRLLNSRKYGRDGPEIIAKHILRNLITHKDAEMIFGSLLGSCCYRHTKYMFPSVELSNSGGAINLSFLQFSSKQELYDDYIKNRMVLINDRLSRVNYGALECNTLVDLSDLYKFKFS